jgi:hypothetical protein
MADVLRFEVNKPETVALQFPEGKNIIDGWQHEKVMFTLEGGRVMFVTPAVAQRIRLLDVKPGQTFAICKGKKGRLNQWDLWLSPETEKAKALEEAPEIERQLRESLVLAQAKRAHAEPLIPSPGNNGTAKPALIPKQPYGPAFARFLVEAGRAAHQAETELGAQGASVRFDSRDIAAIATTMFIGANDRGCLEVGL